MDYIISPHIQISPGTEICNKKKLEEKTKSAGRRSGYIRRTFERCGWKPRIVGEDYQYAGKVLKILESNTIYDAIRRLLKRLGNCQYYRTNENTF